MNCFFLGSGGPIFVPKGRECGRLQEDQRVSLLVIWLDGALQLAQQAAEMPPASHIFDPLAVVHFRRGEWDAAEEAWKNCIELNRPSDDPEAWFHLGEGLRIQEPDRLGHCSLPGSASIASHLSRGDACVGDQQRRTCLRDWTGDGSQRQLLYSRAISPELRLAIKWVRCHETMKRCVGSAALERWIRKTARPVVWRGIGGAITLPQSYPGLRYSRALRKSAVCRSKLQRTENELVHPSGVEPETF